MPSSDLYNLAEYATSSADAAEVASAAEGLLVFIAGMGMVAVFFALAVAILSIIANWKIFKKAGQKGWKSIVPILNTVTLFKIAGVSPWLILAYFAAFIPVVGILICLGITIYVYINLAKAFGKGAGFTVGLILVNAIFMMILAFGGAEYQLNKQETEESDSINQL